jgi:hypothetical protein
MSSEFYCISELPKPPLDVIKEIITSKNPQFITRSSITDQQKKIIHNTSHFSIGDETYRRSLYRRYNLGKLSEDWVRCNIAEEYTQLGSQVMHSGDAFFPHTDGGPRRYILNYLIDTGGDNVETRWYQEPGYGIVRDGDAMQWPGNSTLETIQSEVFPVNSWSCLFGKVIHGVVGLTSPRIQLSIGFSAEEFLKLKERHGIMLKYHG